MKVMLEDHAQGLSNGRDRASLPGLGNTNPVAGLGSTLGPIVTAGPEKESLGWEMEIPQDLLAAPYERPFTRLRKSAEQLSVSPSKARFLQPKGQVVLFKKVMEDWGFDKNEAALLLGFETGADIGEVYTGAKPIGHRDANDRLRTVLRIATDLDALFKEIVPIRDWLGEAQSDLNGASPRSLLIEGSMENLLRVKYYVAYLSGR